MFHCLDSCLSPRSSKRSEKFAGLVWGSESLIKKPSYSPGVSILPPVRITNTPVVVLFCRNRKHSGNSRPRKRVLISRESHSPVTPSSSRNCPRMSFIKASCSHTDAHRWFMSFCRITPRFSTRRAIMLLEYSSSVAPVLLTTKVPMVIMPCASIMVISGMRKILNMVGFRLFLPFMSSPPACRLFQRVVK